MAKKEQIKNENTKLLLLAKESPSFCNAFIFNLEKGRQLAILIKMDRKSKENREIAQGLVEIIKNEFYANPQRNPAENLEAGLIKTNEILRELASIGKIDWVGKLNALAACLYGKTLVLAQMGKISTLLIRDGEANFIAAEKEEKEVSQIKNIFQGITFGELENGDYLVFSTSDLWEFFSPLKLVQILNQKNILEAKDYIRDLILEQTDKETLGTLLFSFKPEPEKKIPKAVPPEKPEQESEEKEESITQEAIQRRIEARKRKQFPYFILYSFKGFLFLLGRMSKNSFLYLGPLMKRGGKGIFILGKKLFIQIGKQTKRIYQKMKTKEREEKKSSLFLKIKTFFQYPRKLLTSGLKFNFRFRRKAESSLKIPLLSSQKVKQPKIQIGKIALASALVMLIAFVCTTSLTRKKNKYLTGSKQQEEQMIEEAQEKRKAALDAMIYQDEKRARELLGEANLLVGRVLSSEKYPQKEEARNLKSEIQNQFDKINQIIHLENPFLVAEISKLNPSLAPLEVINLGEFLYTFCAPNNVILRLDLEKKETVQVSPNFANIGHLEQGVEIDEGKNIIFVNEEGEFSLFNVAAFKIEKITAPPPFDSNHIQALAQYSNKIYTLNPDQNQIVKYARTLSGLSKGALWLKNGNVEKGMSLAIDGDVYIVTSEGKILKFHGGEPRGFESAEINPPLSSPNQIFTSPGYKNLYLLDPPTKRIIVLEKENGKLVAQFTSDKFAELKDIWVTPDEKMIYVLAGQTIWGFENKRN